MSDEETPHGEGSIDDTKDDAVADRVATYGVLGGLCCLSSVPALAGVALLIGLIGATAFGDRLGIDLTIEQWKILLVVIGLPVVLWLGISHWRSEKRRRDS